MKNEDITGLREAARRFWLLSNGMRWDIHGLGSPWEALQPICQLHVCSLCSGCPVAEKLKMSNCILVSPYNEADGIWDVAQTRESQNQVPWIDKMKRDFQTACLHESWFLEDVLKGLEDERSNAAVHPYRNNCCLPCRGLAVQ